MPSSKKGRDLSRLGLVGSEQAGAAWQSLVAHAELPGERLEGARELPIDLIAPFAGQPRKRFDEKRLKGLAESIGEDGVIQPIGVRAHPDEAGRYMIVAGERRWRAARLAGLTSIPAVITEDADEATTARKMLRENVEREDLDIEDLGLYLQTLVEQERATQRDLVALTHFSLGKVNALLKLVKYPYLLELIRNGQITQEQAIELTKYERLLEPLRKGTISPLAALELTKHPDLIALLDQGVMTPTQAIEFLRGQAPSPAPAPPARPARAGARNPYRRLEEVAAWAATFRPGRVPVADRAAVRMYLEHTIAQLNALYAALGDDAPEES
jgi:ParB/RepB/Spo0J family partition protein